ncbi:MAG: MXAN_6640 family putative metalloprotease [Marmoricola sp.]
MHNRLGGLLALALALPLGLAPAAQAAVHPSGHGVRSAAWVTHGQQHRSQHARRHADPHLRPLPSVPHGTAVAALHHAEHVIAPAVPARPGARIAERPVADRSATLALRDLWLARRSLTGADRRTAQGLLARPTQAGPGNPDDDPVSFTPAELAAVQHECSQNFCVTYTTASGKGSYVDGSGTAHRWNNAATAATARADLQVLENVWSTEIGRLGYRPPLTDDVAPPGDTDPADVPKIDIYLVDLRPLGYYGYCSPDDNAPHLRQMPAYCVLDNDFADYGTAPSRALEVTAAHEFFHAVQFGYNLAQPKWFMEGSAVWMEDQVYDSINDYLQYVATSPIRQPLTPFTAPHNQYEWYGAFTIFTFLSSWLDDRDAVRQAWDRAVTRPALSAVTDVLTAHHRDLRTAFATFGLWNTLPARSYPERASYRPAGAWRVTRLTPRHRSTGTEAVQVHALASAPAVFLPSAGLSGHSRLRVVLRSPRPRAGGAATVQVRLRDGRVRQSRLRLHGNGSLRLDEPFSPRRVRSVVVTMTNAATTGGSHRFRVAASVR